MSDRAVGMVATLAQMASAAYYLESQRSFRHPNEYYTAGEEPDGVWWNPSGLFGLADGGRVDGGEFHRLYHGFAPDGGERLTRNAGSEKRSPGLDMTFSADKSVSALWAKLDRHSVAVASSGIEAANLTEREKFDVIITDMKMPGMDGASFYRQVRQRDPQQARRIIFITGDTVSPDTRAFLQRVSNPVLAKPFKIGPLRDAIESVMSQQG